MCKCAKVGLEKKFRKNLPSFQSLERLEFTAMSGAAIDQISGDD